MSEVPCLKVVRTQHKPHSGHNMSTTRPSYSILNITLFPLYMYLHLPSWNSRVVTLKSKLSQTTSMQIAKIIVKTPDLLMMIEF